MTMMMTMMMMTMTMMTTMTIDKTTQHDDDETTDLSFTFCILYTQAASVIDNAKVHVYSFYNKHTRRREDESCL